ncbi:D-ribitol-5-phosphate cytidylyltransferase [Sarcoptes scabiei]|uniref:Isoprenoid synthase domain-containing protein n=2 Tax=Sarcoptes scabiei TaxID=52283 RepID=A0A834R6E7_SARSC|nr:D-ribitol-5-phosphate cytidylyltransferase [Sarcoptes scabiei]
MSKLSLINVNSFKFVVIIPAAGSSERMRSSSFSLSSSSLSNQNGPLNKNPVFRRQQVLPKQYQIACSKPLIYHTVSSFLRLKWIDYIIVLASPELLKKMDELLSSLAKQQQKRFECIAGGTTRHRTIKIGLEHIEQKKLQPDYIIVHDGARPLIDERNLQELLTECYQHGAAGFCCDLTSTIISVHKDTSTLNEVLDRSKYLASETPQAFRSNLILDAYRKCTDDDLDYNTECLDLVKRYTKFDAKLLPVDPNLYFKVTYRKDLFAADNILKEHRNILLHCDFDCDKPFINYKFIKQLKDDLVANFADVKYFSDSVKIKNLVQHSPGTVHVLLHYCEHWNIVLEQNLAAYEHLVYIVVNSDKDNVELTNGASSSLLKWSKSVISKEIKNFYLIFTHAKNLDQESLRIRNIVVYLSKELPVEVSGQTFFI